MRAAPLFLSAVCHCESHGQTSKKLIALSTSGWLSLSSNYLPTQSMATMETTKDDEHLINESKCDANQQAQANPDESARNRLGSDDMLKTIADSGVVNVDWTQLQQALTVRLEQVLDIYATKNDNSKSNNNNNDDEQYQEPNVEKFSLEHSRKELLELINSFNEPPFTIQRICELLHAPLSYYDKVSPFFRGLEKNLRVVSSNNWPIVSQPNHVVSEKFNVHQEEDVEMDSEPPFQPENESSSQSLVHQDAPSQAQEPQNQAVSDQQQSIEKQAEIEPEPEPKSESEPEPEPTPMVEAQQETAAT